MEEGNTTGERPALNKRLKEAREQRGWTHKDVADMLNVPDTRMISRWEHGLHTPQPHYRRQLAELFGKSLEELGFLKSEASEHPRIESSSMYSRSLSSRWNIPPTFTSLLGREQDIAAVCTLLQRSDIRLLTLFGPGGVGKTRLGIQTAREVQASFKDGIHFVSLSEIKNPAFVSSTLAEVLGVQENGQLSVIEQVKATLVDKQCLLLLDNFEQIVQAALFLEELLAACPAIKMLVTSRSILRLSAEHTYAVLPLALPDPTHQSERAALCQYASVALFIERAQAVRSTFQVTDENIHSITEICAHLDGLPLAIELAAARIKLLSPAAMLARLTQRFHLLTSELRAVPDRQRTLYQTMIWSYDLLTAQEQWFYRRLSVFSGGCTIEAAVAVCGKPGEPESNVFSLLASLLDQSLLQQETLETDNPRFILLESVREYGLERLREHNEMEESQREHALYYLAFVEQVLPYLTGSQQTTWLAQLDQEKDNLRAALTWLLNKNEVELALRFGEGFGKFCGLRGYWTEEWRWLQAILELPTTPALYSLRARILRRAGHLAYRLRQLVVARIWQEESIELSRESGDQNNLVGALSGLGWTLYRQNTVTLAEQLLNESVEVALASGNKWVLANALDSLGRFMHYQSRSAEARALLERSVVLARELADNENLARILTSLVSLELAQGNHTQATALAEESFALAQECGSKPILALVLDSLADIAVFQKAYDNATNLLEKRILQAEEIGDIPTIARKRLQLGDIALRRGDFAQAEALAQQSLVFFQRQGDSLNITVALDILANIKCLRRTGEEA